MKISKEKANNAAIKIAAPIKARIDLHMEKINKDVREIYEKKVPKDVMEWFKKHPSFFRTESSYCMGKVNGRYVYARFGVAIPDIEDISFTAKEKDAFTALVNTLETLEEQYETTVLTIENTILSLGTVKRVVAEFPEAVPFLDCPLPNTSLMLNIAPVRKMACALIPNCKDGKK